MDKDPAPVSGFTSGIPWENAPADCLVVCCSDPRFERQTDDFLGSLGYKQPHKLQVPTGPALLHPLVSALGFLSKAADTIVEKAVQVTGARDVICIAHQHCLAYNAGGIKLVNLAFKALAGAGPHETQVEHLRKAGRRLEQTVSGIRVKAFFAEVVENGEGKSFVRFRPVPLKKEI
jgi:hypothetical protein